VVVFFVYSDAMEALDVEEEEQEEHCGQDKQGMLVNLRENLTMGANDTDDKFCGDNMKISVAVSVQSICLCYSRGGGQERENAPSERNPGHVLWCNTIISYNLFGVFCVFRTLWCKEEVELFR
jgi:hypothetical protein